MTTNSRTPIQVIALLHGLSLIAAVGSQFAFRDAAIEAADAQLASKMIWLPGGLVTMGIVSISFVVLTYLNVVLVWRGVSLARWTLTTWWVMTILMMFLVGASASPAAALLADAVLYATAGIMLWHAFTTSRN